MTYIILSIIVSLNLSPFILQKFVIWRAQGIGLRFLILTVFCASLVLPRIYKERNLPLAVLVGWIGFVSLLLYGSQGNGLAFTAYHISQILNIVSFIILYKAIVEFCTDGQLWEIFVWLRYSIIFTLILCVLQKFGLSQFFSLLVADNKLIDNLVTGLIGNGTHLSGFLAMCSPLFFTKKREDLLCLLLMFILLFSCGQSTQDPSISGFFILVVLLGVFLFRVCRKGFYTFCCLLFIGTIVFLSLVDEKVVDQFFNFNGRVGFWAAYIPTLKSHFVTGIGLGSVFTLAQKTGMPKHLHFEYFQILVEIGVVGLMLVIWNIKDFFKIRAGGARFRYQLIFLGFLLSGLFNYPMHLWLPATYACIAYACVVALRREEC